jgi:hypothetical protein
VNEFLQFNIGQVAQIVIFALGIGFVFQQVKSDVRYQNERLARIETEITTFRQFLVSSAKLEERMEGVRQVVLAQGKRLDRVIERVYGKKTTEENDNYF